ncbi:PREDICTED: uncharacterized protein LOC104814215 [Tarenaya hassleriana]|uniref:uncharacterized protein LOC104814215 n=1 Tax=Tarenaya hassleriana TaxID=28532 RepID=UPI00053C506F|nr:PREDICTED: uncharacterized protein LOC104814215 [Tarenaya hassleriana]
MTGLGIRSSSYGSLEKTTTQNGIVLPLQTTMTTRSKPSKMQKDREGIVHWICKFAGRKKVGMLLLCLISAIVFVWVLYVGKGEDAREVQGPSSLQLNVINSTVNDPDTQKISYNRNLSSSIDISVYPPPPPPYFLGYTLPQGHPCNSFTLPPPPADKKRTGPRPCPVCYLPVEEAIALMPKAPSFSPVLKDLSYIYEQPLNKETEFGGSEFGGYPSLKQRNDSFDIKDTMSVHCGFVKGPQPGRGTGFDIDESDLRDMEQCHGIVVASAVFGAFDDVKEPKRISKHSEETVCFYMFVDEETREFLKRERGLDDTKKIGKWRIVVVQNLPYSDGRRNGKIPKLLVHRLFPNARFSIWIDGKLELVVDPYQILERFLWRKNATFAISRHYKRFDVLVEAEANKAAGKYDNASIDFQVNFYKNEGLTPYSEAKLPITSDVPEGCVIIREHVPISNLFTCLWFNEVDRFTSRDQISFSTIRDKVTSKTKWTLNMFLDCERRNFVVQRYHRAEQEMLARRRPRLLPPPSPPPPLNVDLPRKLSYGSRIRERIVSTTPVRRRGRDKRSSSRHRKASFPSAL